MSLGSPCKVGRLRRFGCASLCLAALALTACSRDQGASVAPHRGEAEAGEGRVDIEPRSPLCSSTLVAAASGTGWSYSWFKNGSPLENGGSSTLAPGHFLKGDRITVTARRGSAESSGAVVIGNSPPLVRSVALEPAGFHRGDDLRALPEGLDPDGDLVRYDYRWSINAVPLSENTPVLKGDRFKKGDLISLVVTPFDDQTSGAPFALRQVSVANAPPVFVSTPPQSFSGTSYRYQAVARDPDADTVTYSLGAAPAAMSIDPRSGATAWEISAADAGRHDVEIIATDSGGARTEQSFTLNIASGGRTGS